MVITWKNYKNYEDARNCTGVIYLHEWAGKPFYWGIANRSFFGGNPRMYEESKRSGRYGTSYRHWIEGCLRHGAKLYIGKLDAEALAIIDEVENFLIYNHPGPPDMNKRKRPLQHIDLIHEGEVPDCLMSK